jgi:hypothetical protein
VLQDSSLRRALQVAQALRVVLALRVVVLALRVVVQALRVLVQALPVAALQAAQGLQPALAER